VLTPVKARQATHMLGEGTPMGEVAAVLGVSRSTLYRRLRAGGGEAEVATAGATTSSKLNGLVT